MSWNCDASPSILEHGSRGTLSRLRLVGTDNPLAMISTQRKCAPVAQLMSSCNGGAGSSGYHDATAAW